jgi:hypothetical protein
MIDFRNIFRSVSLDCVLLTTFTFVFSGGLLSAQIPFSNPWHEVDKNTYRNKLKPIKENQSASGVLVLNVCDLESGQELYWNGKRLLSREEKDKKFDSQRERLLHYYIQDSSGNAVNWKGENTVDIKLNSDDNRNRSFIPADFSYRYIPAESEFGFAFSLPHRITVGLPVNSNRTILDVFENKLKISWTNENLVYYPFVSFRPLIADWGIMITPTVDNEVISHVQWTRIDGYLPALKNEYEKDGVLISLEALGADTATLIKVILINKGKIRRHISLHTENQGWAGYNPQWVDSSEVPDRLLAGWNAPADQILELGVGAEKFEMTSPGTMNMHWNLNPGETKIAWIIRPYHCYSRQTEWLRAVSWDEEFTRAKAPWEKLRSSVTEIHVPDSFVTNAFYASLADCFIMREPIGKGYISAVMGTENYRSGPANFEPSLVGVALDQVGLHEDAVKGLQVDYDLQEANGDWTEPGGWGHLMWGGSGFKEWSGYLWRLLPA